MDLIKGLTINNLHLQLGKFSLSVSLIEVASGEILSVIGPSGSGKSSLCLAIAGFLPIMDGIIVSPTNNRLQTLPPERRGVGIVFQRPALFPLMSVRENIEFGLRVRGITRLARRAISEKWLARLQIEELADRMPFELSGGQAQRVALARVFAVGFQVLILDEPFSSLDPPLRKSLRELVSQLVKEHGVSCLMVSHDKEDVVSLSHRAVVLEKGKPSYLGNLAEGRRECPWLDRFLD